MEAYTNVTDNVFYQILYSTDSKLKPARELLERIQRRELYACIGATFFNEEQAKVQVNIKHVEDYQ